MVSHQIRLSSALAAFCLAIAIGGRTLAADEAHKTCGMHTKLKGEGKPMYVKPSTGLGDSEATACEAAKENANLAICALMNRPPHQMPYIMSFSACGCARTPKNMTSNVESSKAWSCSTNVNYGVLYVEW